jgi:drug/metabolite transporter (DMT)-like permease
MLTGLLAGLGAAVLFGGAAVLQASVVRRAENADHLRGFLLAVRHHRELLLVAGCYLMGFALHAVAIWHLPLYLAQATIAMALPVTTVTVGLIHEQVTRRQWLSVATVVAGLMLLAAGAGAAGPSRHSMWFPVALVIGLAVLIAVALSRHVTSGPVLGAVAGLGYAGCAISLRGIRLPIDAGTIVSALAVAGFGLVAFWLYSAALQHSAVSAATASLVVAETGAPTVVGLVLLGDAIRPGWTPAIALGIALAIAGAIGVGHGAQPVVTDPLPDPS